MVTAKEIFDKKSVSVWDYSGYQDYTRDMIIRVFPIKMFDIPRYEEYYKSTIRYLINPRRVLESLKECISNYPGYKLYHFLKYAVDNFPHIAAPLKELYSTMNTWEIADYLGVSQHTIRNLYGDDGFKLSNRSMRCSKAHLSMKPIIESVIGPTVTEYYFEGYWFDEYSEKYKLDIEIDGAWCHDPDYDAERDDYVKSKGLKVVRIPAYTEESEVINLLKDFLNTL